MGWVTEPADATSEMIAFLKSAGQADVDYASALAANLGAYQVAWRQGILDTLPSGNALIPVWTAEIAWAGAIAGARNAYVSAVGGAGMTYTTTVLDAYGVFNDAAWNAVESYNNGSKIAGNSYSSAMRTANRAYAQSTFNAEKAHTMALFAAERDYGTDSSQKDSLIIAALEAKNARDNANATKAAANSASAEIDLLMSLLGELDANYTYNNWLTDAGTTSAALTTLKNTEIGSNGQSGLRGIRLTDAATEIANKKIANAIAKTDAENAAKNKLEYDNGLADANILIAYLNSGATYVSAIKGLQNAYGNSINGASDAYLKTIIQASNEYENEYCRLTGRYYDAVKQINLGYGIDANFFANGATSTDVQVCFVAGTPILLADETHKVIETIQPGDVVLAKDHRNPNGELLKCRVVRVFHNEPQSLWKLCFGELEIRATKEHPFYVQGKGWVAVEELEIGDVCRSVTNTDMVLTAKSFDPTPEPVYNFEVENAHTYFVGESKEQSVLAHNACSLCGGNHPISTTPPPASIYERFGNWWNSVEFWNRAGDCEVYLKKMQTIQSTPTENMVWPSQIIDDISKERELVYNISEGSLKVAEAANTAAGVLVGAGSAKQVCKNIGEYAFTEATGIPIVPLPRKVPRKANLVSESIDVIPNHPPGHTTSLDTTAFGNGVNLASPKRTLHILIGEKLGSGGHQFPGNLNKTLFPTHWSSGKIMEGVSDVATNPNSTIKHITGTGGLYTKAGKPARFEAIGTYDGVKIKVILEPAGEGIITAHPIK